MTASNMNTLDAAVKRHVEQLSSSRTSGDSTESMSLRDEMKNGNCSNHKGKK